jgi:hypothetical protein
MDEQRQTRLQKKKEGTRSKRMNETDEQYQKRLEKQKKRDQSSRSNETDEQYQKRLQTQKERHQSSRSNETEEERRMRLDQQRKRSQANRTKKKLQKRASDNIRDQQQNIEMQLSGTEEYAPSWPEPISRDLKETRLKQFLQRMSMSALAEVTCGVCNIRTPVQKSKKLQLSKIPHIDLLKVNDQLKDLIISTQSSTLQNSNGSNIQMVEHDQSNI